jgi:hypothetical protein
MYHMGINLGLTGASGGIGIVVGADAYTTGRHVSATPATLTTAAAHSTGITLAYLYLALAVFMLLVSAFFAARQVRARVRFGDE